MTIPFWGMGILVGLIISLGLLLLWFILKSEDDTKIKTPEVRITKKRGLKEIPSEMEFNKIEAKHYIVPVTLRRCFDPRQKPGVDQFIRGLVYHRPHCKCGNTFKVKRFEGRKYFVCMNKDNHSGDLFHYQIIDLKSELTDIRAEYEGEIRRSEYETSWKIYKDWYDNMTGGNYDEYYPTYDFPIHQIVIDK